MTDHHRPAAFNEEAYEEIKRRQLGQSARVLPTEGRMLR